MKKEKIKALAERVGQSRAERFWALFVERLCDGIEPEVGDTFKREDIEKRFENNPVARDAFVAVFCGDQKETPKGKKYKAGRPYGAAEYSAFYAKTPEDVALVADIARATDGKAWVIAPEGKFCEGPSAKFIQWHMDQDIAPATIDVDGVPVAPVLPGQEKAPKEAYVDPFDPGTFLDVEMGSRRTGASFKGYSDEALSAMQFLYLRHLTGEGNLSLNGLVTANRGKTAAEILAPFPSVLAEWNSVKPEQRPKAKAARRPFAEPPAPTVAPRGGDVARPDGWIPTLCFVGARGDNKELWGKLKGHLVAAQDAGLFRMVSDDDVPPGGETTKLIAGYMAASDAVFHLATVASISREKRALTLAFDGPRVPVILGHFAALDMLFPDLKPIPANGKPIEGERAMAAAAREITDFSRHLRPRQTASSRPTWTSETLRTVHAAMVSAGLDRNTLLAGLPADLASSLPRADNPSAQLMRDMMMLKDVRMSDGSTPLREYIATAAQLASGRSEVVVFREAMAALG